MINGLFDRFAKIIIFASHLNTLALDEHRHTYSQAHTHSQKCFKALCVCALGRSSRVVSLTKQQIFLAQILSQNF